METSRADNNRPAWYVLNHIGSGPYQAAAQKSVERFNAGADEPLELFAPSYFVRENRAGKNRYRRVSLAYHYVFVRGNLKDIKRLCSQSNGFSFLLNRAGKERYAIVSDSEMDTFRIIARRFENSLPFFSVEDIDFESGDEVEVISGDFPGLKGIYIPTPKSNSGKIVLGVAVGNSTCAWDIKASEVRVLKFAANTTRANDQMEALTSHLFEALRLFRENKPLTSSLTTRLSVFCSRMEVVKLGTPKLDAKLQALLYAANTVLGNPEAAAKNLEAYKKAATAVTNPWTVALITLILEVVSGKTDQLKTALETLPAPSSKAQKNILAEYRYYLSTNG